MNFLSRLTRWIGAKTNDVFYYNNFTVGDSGNIWIDTEKPFKYYQEIPQLPIVVNRIARMTANGIWAIKDKEGNYIETKEANDVLNLLRKPSFIQTENKYIETNVKQLCVYGNSFVRKNIVSPLQKVPQNIITMSPQLVQPVLTGLLYDQISIEGVIAGYQYIDNKITKPYATNEIIWLKFDSLDNPIVGESPITQLKYPLSNTQEAYKYRNSILAKKGALGIVSRDEKDAAGSVSWSENDRREFEEQYFSKYGSGDNQRAFMLTKHPLKFTPTSYPTKDMLLFEEIDANLATIAMLYGASTNIFDTKTTFENLKNGIIQTYQDCIFPIADILAQGHKQGLGLPDEWELCLTYDHIELLKESKLRGAQAVNQGLTAITNALSNGLITQEQAASASDSLIATVI